MTNSRITLEGVRVNNLRQLNLNIRHNALTVICGVSGSGKSSLAFDTLFAEGQRRYIETFSPYLRQFLDRIERPAADRISGIPPAVALRQNSNLASRQSTVGTRTEIDVYLRTLFARAGELFCPNCKCPIDTWTADAAASHLVNTAVDKRAMFVAKLHATQADELLQEGYTRAVVGDSVVPLENAIANSGDGSAEWNVVVDRLRLNHNSRTRISESISQIFQRADGRCSVLVVQSHPTADSLLVDGVHWQEVRFSTQPACASCGRRFEKPTAEALNFRSAKGACSTCEGRGSVSTLSLRKVVPDDRKSIREGAIPLWTTPAYRHELDALFGLSDGHDLPVDVPFQSLNERQRAIIQQGVPESNFGGLDGFHRWMVRNRYKKGVSVLLNRWRTWQKCPSCNGSRLAQFADAVRLNERTIADANSLEVSELRRWLDQTAESLADDVRTSLALVLQQLKSRISMLQEIGLGYLQLSRPIPTLSGGEAQRVALTASLGSGLIHTLYILDEPTSGLHARETRKVIDIVRRLQEQRNTVVVVEHDTQFIKAADEVIEIGPGAGSGGGELVFQGSPDVLATMDTLTGQSLKQIGRCSSTDDDSAKPENSSIPDVGPTQPSESERATTAARDWNSCEWLRLRGASCHNVQTLDLDIPLSAMSAVTGVSGSGKTSLIVGTLYPELCRQLGQVSAIESDGRARQLTGTEHLSGTVLLDQSPLPRSVRSVPATCIGVFDDIRKLLSETHVAKTRNYAPGKFSFNSASGGRCDQCQGRGFVTVEMQFLADIQTTCEACHGRRFRPEITDVRYRDRAVHEILQMTSDAAFTFFSGHSRIQKRLNALRQAGLGYLTLGQPLSELSGGESQRLRIACLLGGIDFSGDSAGQAGKATKPGTLFILDEPSTGLHGHDIGRLMTCLRHLVQIGHTVVVIEHDPGVVSQCDFLIELGPGAGKQGGKLVRSTPVDATVTWGS